MPATPGLEVSFAALPGVAGAARRAAAAADPGTLAAACADGVAGLAGLTSAGVLDELARHLVAVLLAVQARWWAVDRSVEGAADRYENLEAALARADGIARPSGPLLGDPDGGPLFGEGPG